MAEDTRVQMPGVFGGLTRYNEEFKSRFMLSPSLVIGFVIAVLLFVIALKIFWPVAVAAG